MINVIWSKIIIKYKAIVQTGWYFHFKPDHLKFGLLSVQDGLLACSS